MSLSENEYVLQKNIHFTYKNEANINSLCQGDILKVTEELSNVLKTVHPYFVSEHYKYFMVLSQSCDLVRRNGKKCKTPYITLAVVRSYSDFLQKVLISGKFVDNVNGFLLLDEKNKERAYQLVERVYNNTEPEYFFLYREDALDFPESMIAFLKVSIALKSEEHYDMCLRAKKMELAEEFKAKLGWLVGNMYSRVGTSDWEEIMSSQAKKEMINNDLRSMCIIGNREQLKQLKTEMIHHSDVLHNYDEAEEYISQIKVRTKYEKVMDVVEDIIQKSGKSISNEDKDKLLKTFKSRNALKSLIT